MKNRSRPFECAIAGRTVAITLRHGGGLQEPGKVYVRCEERDCQYVDLNQPPCPLRADMFSDGSDLRVAQHLAGQAGAHVCYACLTETLGITHEQVRRATWRLREEIGVIIRPSRCASCRRRRVTIGLPTGAVVPATETPAVEPRAAREDDMDVAPDVAARADEVSRSLRQRSGFAFCIHCLARDLSCTAAEMRTAMWALERDPSYPVRTGQCVSCLLVKRVIRHQAASPEVEGPRRVLQFILQAGPDAHCASCLAFATDLPLAEVRLALQTVEGAAELERREGACTVCGRWQPVVAKREGAAADPTRAADLADVAAGSIRYRGCRIELLSFRVSEGWRPRVLIRTAVGTLMPDAPGILMTVTASKLEADELAVAEARAWIDKRFP